MTEQTQVAEESPPAPRRGFFARAAGIFGEVLITLGVLLLLVVVYELWWTNLLADREITAGRDQLVSEWQEPPAPETVVAPDPDPVAVSDGEPFALIYIPRIKDDVWGIPLIEGVSDEDLAKGISHFPGTALPGETGNFALAGHRATHGEPLRFIDQLQPGDTVYVETETGWYSYVLNRDEIVLPTDVWVVDPVPGQPVGTVPTQSIITLLTCNPRWSSTERWVWWGELTEVTHKSEGVPQEIESLGGVA